MKTTTSIVIAGALIAASSFAGDLLATYSYMQMKPNVEEVEELVLPSEEPTSISLPPSPSDHQVLDTLDV